MPGKTSFNKKLKNDKPRNKKLGLTMDNIKKFNDANPIPKNDNLMSPFGTGSSQLCYKKIRCV